MLFVFQCISVIDPLTLDQMDFSSTQQKFKMDALCELTAKIKENPQLGNVMEHWELVYPRKKLFCGNSLIGCSAM